MLEVWLKYGHFGKHLAKTCGRRRTGLMHSNMLPDAEYVAPNVTGSE